jgi:tRNA pseudouridine(38-40) synthase
MATLALTLSYDGRNFSGSQIQPTGRTVQGALAEALANVYGEPVATVFAGRTDAGVHAAAQVVSLTEPGIGRRGTALRAALNHWLPDDIAVATVDMAADSFSARFDARWREYRYFVWSGGREPLANGWVWRRSAVLDVEAMRQSASMLMGTHDFASFVGGGEGVPWSKRRGQEHGTVRTLFASRVRECDPWWRPSLRLRASCSSTASPATGSSHRWFARSPAPWSTLGVAPAIQGGSASCWSGGTGGWDLRRRRPTD